MKTKRKKTAVVPIGNIPNQPLDPQATAAEFLDVYQMAFSDSPKQFYLFNADRSNWEPISANQLQRQIKSWVEASQQFTPPVPLLRKIVTEIEVAAPLWSSSVKPGQIIVNNGVLDLTGSPPQLLQRNSNIHFDHSLNVDYVEDAACPQFQQFLSAGLNDDDAALVQKWVGSLLVGPNSAQVLLALVGQTGIGKGTLVKLIIRLVGVAATAELREDKLLDRFESAAYLDKRLLVMPEIPADLFNLKGINRLKALVGQDHMEAELKMRNRRIAFSGNFHVVVYGNQINPQPWSEDLDAFRRRLLVVQYDKPGPAKIIYDFADKLWKEEGSGILNWAVEGVAKYREGVGANSRFVLTVEQQQRVDQIIPPRPATTAATTPLPSQPPTVQQIGWFRRIVQWISGWVAGKHLPPNPKQPDADQTQPGRPL